MGKKRQADEQPSGLDRIFTLLDTAPLGLHDLDPPAAVLPEGLPGPLIELYAHCDGGRLFLDTLELVSSTAVESPMPGRWQFATLEGAAVTLDVRGRVLIADESLDDEIVEGTRLDRFLAGFIDATAMLYDGDGEFNEGVFDDDGDIEPAIRTRQLKAQLKRDPAAPAPRWRLAGLLTDTGAIEDARNELEQVVSDDPAFAWAWLDLARLSERHGELPGALDEARMAAETAEAAQHPQAGYFYAQLARIAARANDEITRASAATKTSLLAPTLKRAQLDGARESIAAGDPDSAKGLVELLKAVWPRDLEVLELARLVNPS